MAQTFYEEMQDVASELLQENGRPLIVRRVADSAPDPTKPWKVTSSSSSDTPVVGVVMTMAVNMREGTKLQRGDSLVLISAKDIPGGILDTDFIVDGIRVLSIQNLILIQPGPTELIYKMIARQWPPRSSS